MSNGRLSRLAIAGLGYLWQRWLVEDNKMDETKSDLVAKVTQGTLVFWIIKILATMLGETGGDAVTMSWLGETTAAAKGTGYLFGTAIFGVVFVVAVLVQIRAKNFTRSSTG